LSRLLQVISLVIVAVGLVGILVIGGLLLISDGDPVNYVRTSLIRFSLNSREEDLTQTVSTDTSPMRFEVNSGDSPALIAQNLLAARLITDADLFVDYVQAYRLDRQLEAGTFFLTQAETIPQIAAALTDSGSSQFTFRILEGWRIEEIAAIIDQSANFGFSGQDFLNLVGAGALVDPGFAAFIGLPIGASLEGFLFPDTYQLPTTMTPEYFREVLLTNFRDRVESVGLPANAAAQGFSLYEIAALGSIIQREAIYPDEHPMISSVYRNRLAISMKLDADPTVQYAIGFDGTTWWSRITQADYSSAVSPYNTYLNNGLPPGPIASPGLSALQAAANPAQSEYYFFQARCTGDGYHNFARTFEEHVSNSCF